MPTITLRSSDPQSVEADVLVVAARPATDADSPAPALVEGVLPGDIAAGIEAQLAALRFAAKPGSCVTLGAVAGIAAPRVVVVGVDEAADAEALRSAAGAALMSCTNAPTVALALPVSSAAQAGAVAEGGALGAYRFTAQRGAAAKSPVLTEQLVVVAPEDDEHTAAVERAHVLAEQVRFARDLVNSSPNLLYPQTFAEAVTRRAEGTKVTVEVLDDEALLAGGYGGIMGVGQGSSRLPRLVTLTYAPEGATQHLGLVGKGITFDSGGLDIKPADGMASMKSDMAGAAAVAATVFAVAELGLPITVTGQLGLAENMPSGTAQRASDVVTMKSDTTVEITNTDAEGRMVLADAMTHAGLGDPDLLVDIATLTGHQVVALGNEIAAVMANDDDFRAQVCAAAATAGEQVWPMPLPKALRSELDTDSADLRHKGGRPGGMLTAGLFLKEFVPTRDGEQIPWAHIDIAGPSFNEGATRGYTPKGGTGFGVATMVALAEELATRD